MTIFKACVDNSCYLLPALMEFCHYFHGLSLEVFIFLSTLRWGKISEKYQKSGVALQWLDPFQIMNFNFFH